VTHTPRGVRLANPGNIRLGDHWQGLARDQKDPDFCTFTAPFWGLRALAKILLNYQGRSGLKTVRQMIERWAPPVENDTGAYVRAAATAVGVDPDARIDLAGNEQHLIAMVTAIVWHENGQQPYSAASIRSACGAASGRLNTTE